MPSELLCFADISMDVLIQVQYLPRADEKQWATVIGEFPGGMGANVAAAYSRLGGRAALVTCVGDDARGAACLADLRSFGVDVSNVTPISEPTFWTFALLDEAGEKSLVEFPSAALNPPWSAIDPGMIEGARAVYTTGTEVGPALPLYRAARDKGVLTALDLETAELDDEGPILAILLVTDILFCRPEAALMLTRAASVADAAQALHTFGPSVVAITLGKEGSIIAVRGQGTETVPGVRVEAVDTTGAGDCYVGAFLYGCVRGWPPVACGDLASLMAAMSVTKYGCRSNLLGLKELMALPQAASLSFGREARV